MARWQRFTAMKMLKILCSGRPRRLYFLSVFTLAAFIGVNWKLTKPLFTRKCSGNETRCYQNGINPNCQYLIASNLENIMKRIEESAEDINPLILFELNKIISQLNPSLSSSNDKFLQGIHLPDTCGELYKGTRYGYPVYKTGFIESPSCKSEEKRPISQLVTILLLDQVMNMNETKLVLQSIYEYDPEIKVILGAVGTRKKLRKLRSKYLKMSVRKVFYEDLLLPGNIMNLMVKQVKTPYILLAKDIFYFNNFARLERQIFILSTINSVGIVGGAFRNESGFWKIGCHLTQIKNYMLKYKEGYKHSALDCMLCDQLEGPFVVKTSVMKRIPFKKNLNVVVVFEDWFLRVKQNNILIMNCPDVLYFKRGTLEGPYVEHEYRKNSSWLKFAREWQIVQIQYTSRVSMKFTCAEMKLSCESSYFDDFLLPPCCAEEVTRAVKIFDNFCTESDLQYEVDSNIMLGVVKFGNFQPWDKKGNATFLTKDLRTYKNSVAYFREREIKLSNFKTNSFWLRTRAFPLEMVGTRELSSISLPPSMWKYPTRVKINGVWVNGKWNPGMYTRNYYGPGYLKHTRNMNFNIPNNTQKSYRPGTWKICPKHAHHASLTRYPYDGSQGLLPEPEFCERSYRM